MRFVSRLSAVAVSLALFSACSSDDTPPTQVPTPTITVAATTAAATAARGASATYPITITRSGGYTGAVTLAASNVPAGVTATFAPATLANGVTSSTLTLAVGATAAAGTNTISVIASGPGVTEKATTVSLTTTVPAAITLVTGSTTATIVQGATTTIPITVSRTAGFTQPITITVDGLPAGVTASALSIPDGSTTGTLTLTATGTAAATTTPANITIKANATGATEQTATVALSVTASTTPGFTVNAAPAALTATAGQGGTSTVTLARTGGFTSDVALTVTGAPAGVTATLAPTTLTGTTATSALTIATTAATVPGTYNLVVRGNSAGQTERTATVALTVNAPAGITVALAPATLSVAQGASGTSNITLARVGSFTGDIALTATGLPTGATIAFAPATATGTATASVATITAGAATPAGTSNVVITGTGAGGVVGTATLALTVTAAQGITVAASNVSVVQGATGTSNITLTRAGGFAGAVGLAVTGLPANVTATFNPTSVTGTTSTLSLAVPNTVAAGTYNGTITATGTGVTNAVGTFTLTVTPASTGGSVAYRFCNASELPLWFAVRNGTSGAWTAVTAGANNTYAFTPTGTVSGVAYAQPGANGQVDVTIDYLTSTELPTAATNVCFNNPATKTVNATIAGLSAGQSADVFLGSGTGTATFPGTSVAIAGATDGVADLIATRYSTTGTGFNTANVPDKLILRRGINPAANSTITPVLDFNAAEAVNVGSATYTFANVGSAFAIQLFTNVVTSNGDGATLLYGPLLSAATTRTVYGIPSTLTQAGDQQLVFASSIDDASGASIRIAAQSNRDLAARTLTFGPTATAPTITVSATTPYVRLRAQGTWQTEYADAIGIAYTQAGANPRSWTINASRGYLGAGGTFDLDLPDFTGVGGFQQTWGLRTGVSTDWRFSAIGGLAGLIGGFSEGATFRVGARTGTITP